MKRKFVCIAAMLIVALSLFVSCENKTSVNETFTLTFDSDGGEAISPLSVTSGKIVSEPKTPTKEGLLSKVGLPHAFCVWRRPYMLLRTVTRHRQKATPD